MSDAHIEPARVKFTSADQVARSRMFPFRWLSAYREAPSLRWAYPLEQALQAAVGNVPALPGRTLVLLDTSASMTRTSLSGKSKVTPLVAGAVFAVALAAKGEQVDLAGFADGVFTHPIRRGASVIREVDAVCARSGEVGHGTNIIGALTSAYRGHDRVVVVTDEQGAASGIITGATTSGAVPRAVPMYCFNLGGYKPAMADWGTPNRVQLGGLTDATFRLIPIVESGRAGNWSAVFGD